MFSQNDEEKYILEYFKGKKGRFLDIGAYNGKSFSNTHALALAGWSGVCVEPSAIPFKDLTALYRDNDKIELVNAVIISRTVDPRFLIEFYEACGDATSTMDKVHYEKWKKTTPFRRIFLKPSNILDIYKKFGYDFNFVSIDTEGTSLDILLDMDIETPEMLCIEHDNQMDRIEQIKGVYDLEELYFNGENVILAKKKAEVKSGEVSQETSSD